MKNIELKIEGMHCNGCSTRLQKILNKTEGIESAEVNLEEKNAKIQYNEERITIDNIKEVIEDAGFKGE